jgi:hypothetical protein
MYTLSSSSSSFFFYFFFLPPVTFPCVQATPPPFHALPGLLQSATDQYDTEPKAASRMLSVMETEENTSERERENIINNINK